MIKLSYTVNEYRDCPPPADKASYEHRGWFYTVSQERFGRFETLEEAVEMGRRMIEELQLAHGVMSAAEFLASRREQNPRC